MHARTAPVAAGRSGAAVPRVAPAQSLIHSGLRHSLQARRRSRDRRSRNSNHEGPWQRPHLHHRPLHADARRTGVASPASRRHHARRRALNPAIAVESPVQPGCPAPCAGRGRHRLPAHGGARRPPPPPKGRPPHRPTRSGGGVTAGSSPTTCWPAGRAWSTSWDPARSSRPRSPQAHASYQMGRCAIRRPTAASRSRGVRRPL